jgi:DNA invertase Pin-like site-specific DNA recombinase
MATRRGIGAYAGSLLALPTRRRRLRVAIYARYSTDEQDASSIEDQFAYCRNHLSKLGLEDVDREYFSDAETSVELRNRPGNDQIWLGVEAHAWDLILFEDSGRLFRNVTACHELVEMAVDAEIRVVCINDNIDTDEDGWDDRLNDAARHHARANQYTRQRIYRRRLALWLMKAALTKVRPGYARRATTPATLRTPEKGPFFDQIDPRWVPVVEHSYQMVADLIPPWGVAKWLTEQRLPKCSNRSSEVWTARNVLDLIRRPIYRGHDVHRVRITQQMRRSGRRRMVRNEKDAVWTRDMPHLRIVSDEFVSLSEIALTALEHQIPARYQRPVEP